MCETQLLLKAKEEASNLENIPWWKSKMPYLRPIGTGYVNGEARRYYKEINRDVYWYRRIAECELHWAK